MLFNKQREDKSKLYSNVDQIIESYRPEFVSLIEEFQGLENLRCNEYIRKSFLITEIERGRLFKKLFLLWIFGVIGVIYRLFHKEVSIEKLDDRDLERVYRDTRLNYMKKTLKELNNSVAAEFAGYGYKYNSIHLEDGVESWRGNKNPPRTAQTRFWCTMSRIFTGSKWVSIILCISPYIGTAFSVIATCISKVLHDDLLLRISFMISAHFISGIVNIFKVFSIWKEDIAVQVEDRSKTEKIVSEDIAEAWIQQFKHQVKAQIEIPEKKRGSKVAWVSLLIILCLGFARFTFWPGGIGLNSGVLGTIGGSSSVTVEPNKLPPNVEIIDKKPLLDRLHHWGSVKLLTKSGSNLVFERSIPKKIFGGTIPTTDLQVTVTYDYTTDFLINLQEVSEEDIVINGDLVKVYLDQPTFNEIRISNDRKEMSGAVFADHGTPEEEIEAFEPGEDSYLDILKKEVETQLLLDQELQEKVILEAKSLVWAILSDSDERIHEVEVIVR